MDLILTFVVGIGLLGCGYYLGIRGGKTLAALTLADFCTNMVVDKFVTLEDLTAYMSKRYNVAWRKNTPN